MSNLWGAETAHDAAPLGSFIMQRLDPVFTAWDEAPKAIDEPEPIDVERIRADSFARGWEEGRRAAEVEFAEEREALAGLAASLEMLTPEPTNALALLLAESVHRLVEQIIGNVGVDAELLASRARAAAAMIGEETAPARMRINPRDLPLLQDAHIPVALVADPSVGRGALVLETGLGWIEDGPAVRLDRLRTELDRLGAP